MQQSSTKHGYEKINQMKAELKASGTRINIPDLLAMAPNNDPFFSGAPGQMKKARWFAAIWDEFGFSTGVYLRRIHYRLVSQENPKKHDGKPYENTEDDWDLLNRAAKAARYLDMVPAELFVDRRNPEAVVNRHVLQPGQSGYFDPSPRFEVTAAGTDEEDWGD